MPCFSYSASFRLDIFAFEPGSATYGTWANCRQRRAERLEDQELRERVGEVLLGADDVGDLHLDVVDDAGEVVKRAAVGPDDHEVADLVGGELDVPLDQVVEDQRPAGRDLEPQREGPALGLELSGLLVGERLAAKPIGPLFAFGRGLVGGALGIGAIVPVDVAGGEQAVGRPAVDARPAGTGSTGPKAPPTSGPSSQSIPIQRKPSRILLTASSTCRCWSVSSMRRMNWPP